MPDGPRECPRCGLVDYFRDTRFWSGSYTERLPDGTTTEYDMLCDDCHREVVRSP